MAGLRQVGGNITQILSQKGKKHEDILVELNQYRNALLQGSGKKKDITIDIVDNWCVGKTALKEVDILSLAKALDVSTDEILIGCPPQDRKNMEEYGLSPKALIALRNHDYAGETLSFFMDNNLIPALVELKKYIEMEHWLTDENMTIRSVLDQNDLVRFRFVENLKKWKNTYWQNKQSKTSKKRKEELSCEQEGKR